MSTKGPKPVNVSMWSAMQTEETADALENKSLFIYIGTLLVALYKTRLSLSNPASNNVLTLSVHYFKFSISRHKSGNDS